MQTNTRKLLAKSICWVLAASLGWQLLYLPRSTPKPALAVKVPQKIRFAAPPKKVQPASREQVLIRAPVAPPVKVATKKVVPPKPVAPPEPVPEVTQAAPEAPTPAPTLVLGQSGLEAPPPAPPDDALPRPAQFEDKPYGTVIVLAVQLNSDNVVVSTDILVPSNNPFNDLTLAMTTRGQQWQNVNPPIPPGHYRWVELRFDYGAGSPKESSILP